MAAVAWPVVLVLYSLLVTADVVFAMEENETTSSSTSAKLKVDIRKETLVGAPSCKHTFTQIELLNLVSCRSTIKTGIYIFDFATFVVK
jgi:hypothetical protein